MYVGSWSGDVYSLDAKTGCIHWMFTAQSGVRSAISIGKLGGDLAAYFGDLSANVYAVNAATGKLLWKVKADDYSLARITGAPKLHGGRLYVPIASREESQNLNPKYECCKFRGSVVALDAATGKRIWKTYTIAEDPRPTRKSPIGTQLWGPSGAGVWVSPTIDLTQKAIYVGTGNNYSFPATSTSDAIIALDMDSGKIRWIRQFTQADMWNGSCMPGRDHGNCADTDSPDFDFAASPILVELRGGQRLLVAAPKSGIVHAIDPDQKGKIIWQQRVGKGGILGGVLFGPATDGQYLYVAISDAVRVGDQFDPNIGGGMVALNLSNGEKIWTTPAPGCGERRPCIPVQGAAVTAIPGAVFSGAGDGHLRAYSTRDGKIVWDYDSLREYTTVNGVKAKGGSIDNGGPAVVGGMLFTNSGYAHHAGVIPGNVLLAFSVESEENW